MTFSGRSLAKYRFSLPDYRPSLLILIFLESVKNANVLGYDMSAIVW